MLSLSRQFRVTFFILPVLLALMFAGCNDANGTTTNLLMPTVSGTPSLVVPRTTPITPIVNQTLEGITVGVQPLHADAHRVTLSISVDGPAKAHAYRIQWHSWADPDNGLPTLSAGDKTLTWIETTSMPLDAAARAGEQLHGRSTLVFTTSGLNSTSATLPIHLSVPLYIDNNPFFPPEPLPTSVVPSTAVATRTAALSTVPPSVLRFAFSMTMPFDSRQAVVQVGQSVTSGDVAITLEQIDITSSEAQVMLRFLPTKPNTFLERDDWTASGTLHIISAGDNSTITLSENPKDEEYPADHGCHSNSPCFLSYLDPLFPIPSPLDCTLTYTAYRASPLQGPWPSSPPLGTWVFQFVIPAISK